MTSLDHLLRESDFVVLLSAVTPEIKGDDKCRTDQYHETIGILYKCS